MMSIYDLANLITERTGLETTTNSGGHAASVIVKNKAVIYWNHRKQEWDMLGTDSLGLDGRVYLRGTDKAVLIAICALLKS